MIWGFPKIRGTLLGGPHNKDYSILGSIVGSPDFGKLPYTDNQERQSHRKGLRASSHAEVEGIEKIAKLSYFENGHRGHNYKQEKQTYVPPR